MFTGNIFFRPPLTWYLLLSYYLWLQRYYVKFYLFPRGSVLYLRIFDLYVQISDPFSSVSKRGPLRSFLCRVGCLVLCLIGDLLGLSCVGSVVEVKSEDCRSWYSIWTRGNSVIYTPLNNFKVILWVCDDEIFFPTLIYKTTKREGEDLIY